MECPKCGIGELIFYKGVETERHYKITKSGKIYNRPYSTQEFETEREYLECKNMGCNRYYNFLMDGEGRIIKESLQEINE